MVLNYAAYFGTPTAPLQSVVDFLIGVRMPDGGFNCESNQHGAMHSSLHSTISVLEGIGEYLSKGVKMAGTNPSPAVFFGGVFLLLAFAHAVFRVIVRREYRLHGRLTSRSSTLQLLAFAGLMAFPYLFNPPEWALFWMLAGPTSRQQQLLGLVIILLGFFVAFGTMGWFGLRRAFGVETKGLVSTGPYRFTRNPRPRPPHRRAAGWRSSTADQVLLLADSQLPADQQQELSSLLAMNREGALSVREQVRLDQLMQDYRHGLIRKAQALQVAVDRGLMPPLN